MSISKEDILDKTNNGLDIFRHYISFEFKVGRNFLNPLYEDKRASCNVYFDRHSRVYRLKDFGNNDYSGDCFDFVGHLCDLDCKKTEHFLEILSTIDRDLHLFINSIKNTNDKVIDNKVSPPLTKNTNKNYQIEPKSFSKKELEYWQQYQISSGVLNKYNVISIHKYKSINKESKPFELISSDLEPIFGYTAKNYIKIYRPFSQLRFLYGGELPESYCFGLDQLPAKGDILFITSGEKDVMSLSAQNFYSICFNSETSHIPKSLIQ